MAEGQGDKSSSETVPDDSLSMRLTVKSLKMKWPGVKTVTTETLHSWLKDESQQKRTVWLLDTRPEEEYVVSHMVNSVRVEPASTGVQETAEKLRNMKPDGDPPTIVTYCSVGYRSTKLAHELRAAMKPKDGTGAGDHQSPKPEIEMYNLEGSLFKWANEGRPLVDVHNKPTVYAHPYSVIWGKLLKADLRKWELPKVPK